MTQESRQKSKESCQEVQNELAGFKNPGEAFNQLDFLSTHFSS